VTISTINSAPVARAGADQTALFGDTVTLDGNASSDVDGDGLTYSWSLTTKPTGSQAILAGSTTVHPSFKIDVSGHYVVQLIVNDGTVDSDPDTVSISTNNSAPVARAGADQAAFFGETVTLNGSASSDVDGDGLTYSWSFSTKPPGSLAKLTGSRTAKASFAIDVSGDYVVQLIVNDATVNSSPDTVRISTKNTAPVASAGADQAVFFGDTVTLDGSASSDVDGDGLTYSWSFTTKPKGSKAKLTGSTTVNPTFAIDVSGDYVVQLIVNDATVDSTPDTVAISTKNTAPVANAGANQAWLFGDTVILDGSASRDVDGDGLTYRWSFTSKPKGSKAALSDSTAEKPIFTIDVSGDYVVQLIVNDGLVDSAPDTVTISTRNSAPVANAGANQEPQVGDTVILDGSASFDVDDDRLTYSWSFALKPKKSKAKLTGSTTVSPTFVMDKPGDYVLQLIVNDGTEDSDPDTMVVTTN
jgi:predicted aspartyl protease